MLNATHALNMPRWWDFSFQFKLASNLLLAWVMLFHPPLSFSLSPEYEIHLALVMKIKGFACPNQKGKVQSVFMLKHTHFV